MATTAAVLNILVTANTSQAVAGLSTVDAKTKQTAATATKSSAVMKKAFLGVGLAAGAAGTALFQVGEEFDDAFDKIRTRTGATQKDMVKLKRVFRDVVSDVPATFDDASTAVGDLNTRLGLTGKPLEKMAKRMTELSRLTGTDLSGNVEAVSKAFVDWEVKTKDQTKTLDGFFRLEQKSGMAVADIAANVQKFGSPLRQLGFSLDEAAAMFANFERAGVNTQTMVPGLKLAISNLTRPTTTLAESMRKLGVETGKPDVALRQVFDLMSTKGLSTVEKTGLAMDVFGKRAGADMAEAIKQGRFELDEFLKVMKDGDGTIPEAGRKAMDLAEHWQQFTNLLKLQVEPVAKKVFQGLGDLMKEVTKTFKKEGLQGVVDLLLQKLGDAIPKVGEMGGRLGLAIVRGLLNAPIWTQLAVGGLLAKKFAGVDLFGAGKNLGKTLGRGLIIGVLIAIPALVVELHNWVAERRERILNIGKSIGEWLVNGMIDAVNLGIRAINEVMDELNALAFVGVDAPNIGEIGKVDWTESVNADQLERQAARVREAVDGIKANWRKGWRAVAESADESSSNVWRYWRDSLGKIVDSGRTQGDKFETALEGAFGGVAGSANKQGGDAFKYWRDWLDQTADTGKTASNRFKNNVAGNFSNLTTAALGAIASLASETNKTLSSLKVKDQVYVANSAGGKKGQTVAAQKGAIVPGTGSGDKVPLHLNGRLAAMVEPGELVSVANRKATAALMETNKRVPRFAKGGDLGGSFNVDGAQPGFVPFMNYLNNLFGPIYVMSGLRPGSITTSGNVSNHSSGRAVDISTEENGLNMATSAATLNSTGAAAKRMDALHSHMSKYIPTSAVSGDFLWRTFTGGNHYNHIHRGITNGMAEDPQKMMAFLSKLPEGKGFAGASALAKMVLEGPDGPLKEAGQMVINRAHKAFSDLLDRKSSTPTFGTGKTQGVAHGLGTYSGPLDRHFPPSTLASPGMRLNEKQMNKVRASANLPPIFNPIALRESDWHPGIQGFDPGGTVGRGLWQITPGAAGPTSLFEGIRGGDYFNPIDNAAMAKYLYDQAGGTAPWGASGFRLGGIVKKLQGGGLLTLLNTIRSSESGADRHASLKDFGAKIKGVGLPEKTAAKLAGLRSKIAEYDEYAQRASSLSSTDANGVETAGVVKGMDEAGWLRKELEALFNLRNRLIDAEAIIDKHRKRMSKLLERAREQLKKVQKELRQGEKEKTDLLEKIEDSKKSNTQNEKHLKAELQKELAKPPKKQDKELIASLREQIRAGGGVEALRGKLGKLVKSQKKIGFVELALRDKILPTIEGQQGKLNTTRGDLLSELQDVQGLGSPMEVRKVLPEMGVLGGTIFDTQERLRNLGIAPETITDTTSTSSDIIGRLEEQIALERELRRQANLRTAVSEAHFATLRDTPFLGAFAKGGVALVGERGPELAHMPSGTRIANAGDTEAMLTPSVQVIVNGDISNVPAGRDPVELVLNDRRFPIAVERAQKQQTRFVGRTPGVPH